MAAYLQEVPCGQEQRRVCLPGFGALLGQRRQGLQAQLANLRAHPDHEGQRSNHRGHPATLKCAPQAGAQRSERVRMRGRPRASGGHMHTCGSGHRTRLTGGPVALHYRLRQTLGKSPGRYELGT